MTQTYNPIVVPSSSNTNYHYVRTHAFLPQISYKSSKTGLLGVSPYSTQQGGLGLRASCSLKVLGFHEYVSFTRNRPGDFLDDFYVLQDAYKARIKLEKERNLLMSCVLLKTRQGIVSSLSTETFPVLWRTKPVVQQDSEMCYMAMRLTLGSGHFNNDLKDGMTRNIGNLFTVERLPLGFWLLSGKGDYLSSVFEDMAGTLECLPEVKSIRVSSFF